MSDEIRPTLTRYRIAEGGSGDTGWYGIEVEDEWGEFVRHADVQRMFTHNDVVGLRALQRICEEWDNGWAIRRALGDAFDPAALASRIAALLPPQGEPK